MPDPLTLAGCLLIAGALVGAAAASHPVLFPVWSAPRDERLRIVGEHRLAWTMLNAGFVMATIVTAALLLVDLPRFRSATTPLTASSGSPTFVGAGDGVEG